MSGAATVTCDVCPRHCRLTPGALGTCRARRNAGDGVVAESYGRVTSLALDPVEKKPLARFHPGSYVVSVGSYGCNLSCPFCQNHEISSGGFGLPVSAPRLAQMMLELEGQGALNINLVTPLHFAPHVREAVGMARAAGLGLPIVCNTSGYERPEVVRALVDVVDVWLTDFKYASGSLAAELSSAPDYPEVAAASLAVMVESLRSAGGRALSEDGSMRRGIIVRHLVLPGHAGDSCAVLDRVWGVAGNDADLSIMNQYTPNEACRLAGGDLSHGISEEEYEIVLCHADDLGFERIWWQEGGTVSESFVPAFDATGVEGPELARPLTSQMS